MCDQRRNDFPQRQSVRLKRYDYSSSGGYFVTICADGKRCLFGSVVNERMVLNEWGAVADRQWQDLPAHHPNVELDYYVVMPNHVHGILLIHGQQPGTAGRAPTFPRTFGQAIAGSLATVVGSYKSGVTRRVNALRTSPDASLWQRNYHEHVIRDEEELAAIRQYIVDNPLKWSVDRENPAATEPESSPPWEKEP